VSQAPVEDLGAFANEYLNVFNTGFHYAFFVAIVAMLISLVVFIVNKNKFPDVKKQVEEAAGTDAPKVTKMEVAEIRKRVMALFAVFGIVIFFWFSFHQNGLTLTYFAKDYTDVSKINIDLGFTKIIGAEIFQSANPLFVVLLTFVVVGLFSWLNKKGKEPSTPKKIAIGMGIAAFAYLIMAIFSYNLPLLSEVKEMGGLPQALKVTPALLIVTYLILDYSRTVHQSAGALLCI